MSLWVLQLKCYDGTDPEVYGQKIRAVKEKTNDLEDLVEGNPAVEVLKRVLCHSVGLPTYEHCENKEEFVKVDWLLVEKSGHKDSLQLHDVLSRSFGYYFKKREKKQLLKYFMRTRLGLDIKFFFRLIKAIAKSAEASCNVFVNEDLTPVWYMTMQRLEYLAQCDRYLKYCEDMVREETLQYLKSVLLERAHSRFQKPMAAMSGEMSRFHFRRAINKTLDMTLGMTKTNSLFSFFDRNGVGILNGQDVSQALITMTTDLQRKKKTKLSAQPCQQPHQSSVSNEESEELLSNEGHHDCAQEEDSSLHQTPHTSFNQTVIKISAVITELLLQGSFLPLDIPDGYVNESFVRTSLRSQLGVKLSHREVVTLCERLRRGNDSGNYNGSARARRGKRDEESAPFLPLLQNNKAPADNKKNVILGKYVKVFILSVKQLCNKKLGLAPRKATFAS